MPDKKTDEPEGILHREEMAAVGTIPKGEAEHPFDPTPDYDREGVLSRDEMEAKTDASGGIHDTSTSIGKVVSDAADDAAGNGPDDLRQLGEGEDGVLGTPAQSNKKSGKRSSKKS